ncbi:unnamed protein product [Cochlearia groenlandica]
MLSPMQMQVRLHDSAKLIVSNGGKDGRILILQGQIGVINHALDHIQYLGLSTKTKNGTNHFDVPVFVETVNDPPFITAPGYVVLPSNGIFSVEVTNGNLVANFPYKFISSSEIKEMFQWQPIQNYATIYNHVNVKASAIRIIGNVQQYNDLMPQFRQQGGEKCALLTLKVNDMGDYGCYLEYCLERVSRSLHALARVYLIIENSFSSLETHVLGFLSVMESLVLFCIGMLLIVFTCKCVFLLRHERRTKQHDTMHDNDEVLNDVSTRTRNIRYINKY